MLIDAINATIDFNTSALDVVSPPVDTLYVGVAFTAATAVNDEKSMIEEYVPAVIPVVVPTEKVYATVPSFFNVGAEPVADTAVSIGIIPVQVPAEPTLFAAKPFESRNLTVRVASSPCTYEALSHEAV